MFNVNPLLICIKIIVLLYPKQDPLDLGRQSLSLLFDPHIDIVLGRYAVTLQNSMSMSCQVLPWNNRVCNTHVYLSHQDNKSDITEEQSPQTEISLCQKCTNHQQQK